MRLLFLLPCLSLLPPPPNQLSSSQTIYSRPTRATGHDGKSSPPSPPPFSLSLSLSYARLRVAQNRRAIDAGSTGLVRRFPLYTATNLEKLFFLTHTPREGGYRRYPPITRR
ncbi:hypothetical protein LZ30DRAFT_448557 [Colletotrichum cereale]|nr:hypothetical protein LZ30DRAFT_448557 [Colletotrichum cereale]